MGLVTLADLDDRQIEYVDSAQASAAIEDASAVARAYVEPVLDSVERGDTPDVPLAVVVVVCGMIRRVLTNPTGLSMEVLGDYTFQAGSNAVATLLPTARERRMLRRAAVTYARDNLLDIPAFGAGGVHMQVELPVTREEEIRLL